MGDTSEPAATDRHPVRKCINNPSHFFGFEKKIIAGQIGTGIQHSNGEMTRFIVSEDFMMNTQRDQGANQDTSTSIGSNMTLIALPLIFAGGAAVVWMGRFLANSARFGSFFGKVFKKDSSFIDFTKHHLLSATGITALLAVPSASWNYKSYEGSGKRRLLSYRVSEQVELVADHIMAQIPLKKYHTCLVIRPRFSAFEPYNDKYEHIWQNTNKVVRSIYQSIGMLLCNEGKDNAFLTEDYYYIYPNYDINSLSMDPRNHRNRPFTITLRGKSEYQKFTRDLSCWITKNTENLKHNTHCRNTETPYDYLFAKRIELVRELRFRIQHPQTLSPDHKSPRVYTPLIFLHRKALFRMTHPVTPPSSIGWQSDSFMDADIEQFYPPYTRWGNRINLTPHRRPKKTICRFHEFVYSRALANSFS